MMRNRRQLCCDSARVAAMLATLGLLPGLARAQAAGWNRAAFHVKTLPDLMQVLGAGSPMPSPDIAVTGPDIAENGAVVPIGASSRKAGVRRLLILVENNPALLAAMFEPTALVEPDISTRIKMGQTSHVYAVALLGDGAVLYAKKEIKVTLGGCGG